MTDKGLVFTTRFSNSGHTSRNGFENELVKLRVRQKNSRPNQPTTRTAPPPERQSIERFHQTMKKWLRTQPAAASISALQSQIDAFVDNYNHQRRHRSLANRSTPAVVYTTRPKARPGTDARNNEFRVRHDRIHTGRVSLRIHGNMHHIGLSRTLDGTRIVMLIVDLDVRIIHATTGEIIRTLTIDPNRRYHGTGKPPGGPKGPRKPTKPERQ